MRLEVFVLVFPVLLFSVVAHEYAHARAAVAQGDPTPAMLGRLTMNPLPHIDPVGSVLVPLALLLLDAGFLFGWARPVPTIPRNYRNYRRGDIVVSSAGVVTNFALAAVFTLALALLGLARDALPVDVRDPLFWLAQYGILINLVLAVFNLLPVPPLDGSHLLYHLLPPAWGARYRAMGHAYGMWLVAVVVIFAGRLVLAPAFWLFALARQVAGL
jgi:Zn-dependent protease